MATRDQQSKDERNFTLKLPARLIQAAKVQAALRGLSVSRYLGEILEREERQRLQYEAIKKEAMAELKQGYRMGSEPLPKRDELYDL